MSLTPIFDQLLAEQPIEFRECSGKIFPTPLQWRQDRINSAKRNHPSYGIPRPLTGRIVSRDPAFMEIKPMVAKPGTKLTLGHDPAGDVMVVGFTDADGVLHWKTQ